MTKILQFLGFFRDIAVCKVQNGAGKVCTAIFSTQKPLGFKIRTIQYVAEVNHCAETTITVYRMLS
jgi:hypothetical protein